MIKIQVNDKSIESEMRGDGNDLLIEGLFVVTHLCKGFENAVPGGAELFQSILKDSLDKGAIADAVKMLCKSCQSTTIRIDPRGGVGNG